MLHKFQIFNLTNSINYSILRTFNHFFYNPKKKHNLSIVREKELPLQAIFLYTKFIITKRQAHHKPINSNFLRDVFLKCFTRVQGNKTEK